MVLVQITTTRHVRVIFQTSKHGKHKEKEKNYISLQIFPSMIPPMIERWNRAKNMEGVKNDIGMDFQFAQPKE